MAGIRDEIDLDVSAALRQVNAIDAALGSVAASFRVELAHALDVLRDVSDVQVDVTADTRQVTADIDKAVEAADTGVLVDADAGDVTGSIDAAVANADTDVTIEADSSDLSDAADRAQDVRDELAAADRAAGAFGGTLGGVKAAAAAVAGAFALRQVVDGIRSAVNAASDLEESTSKVRVVFGESASEIERWGDTSAEAVGLAKQEALEAAGTFGNLFTAMGATSDVAADLAPEVVQLGADLASFNNLGVEETLEKLRSGLVGEIEPLRSLGVSFGAAQVEAKAMELGLAGVNGEVTEGAKLQARWALILEQSTAAQGDFARTSDGLANQQRILAAEVGNLRAEVGAALLPVMKEIITAVREALPEFRDLAEGAVPALSGGVRAFLPIGLSFLDLLVALGPAIELVADIIDSLPAPVLQMVTAFGLLGSGLGPFPNLFSRFVSGARGVEGSLFSLRGGFAAINPWVLAGTAAVVGLTAVLSSHRKEQQENEQAIDSTTQAFRDQTAAIDEDVAALVRQRVESKNQVDDLRRLGLSFEEFTALVRRGAAGEAEFVQSLIEAGEVQVNARQGIDSLAEAIEFYGSVERAVRAGVISGNTGLIKSYRDLGAQSQKAAEAQLDYLVANEEVTAADVEQAEERNRLADGTTDFVAVLEDVAPVQEDVERATTKATGAEEEQVATLDDLEGALSDATSALDDFLGRQVTGIEGQIAYEEALDSLTESVKENGRTLDVNTEKGRANIEAVLDARQSIIDLAKARFEETGSAEDAAGVVEMLTARYADQLRQAGLTEQQVADYIATLNLTPEDVLTVLNVDDVDAIGKLRGFAALTRSIGEEAAANFVAGLVAGFRNDEGLVVGSADAMARQIEATVNRRLGIRSPSTVGMEIGGFFVEGITLGIEAETQIAEQAALALAGGVGDIMLDAAQITQAESLAILQAVASVRSAEESLAEAREEHGRGSLEAAIAERELAEAQAEVNRRTLDAIDATDEITEALERQREARDELNDSLDRSLDALDAVGGVRAAQRALDRANRELADAQKRAAALPSELAAARARLAAAAARSREVTAEEAAAIVRARQAVVRAEERVAEVNADVTASADDRELATLDLEIAQNRLTEAEEQSVAMTREVEVAERALTALREEQEEVAQRLADANDEVTDAELRLVAAQRDLIEAGAELVADGPEWEAFFRMIAQQAGLSQGAIQGLIDAMREAGRLAGNANSVIGGGTGTGTTGRLINTVTGRPAFTGPNGEGGWGADPGIPGAVAWVMPDGTRVWYVPGQNIDPGNLGALGQVATVNTPVAPNIGATVTKPPSAFPTRSDVRQTFVTVNPKTAIYDPRQTVATVRTLELLNL